MPAAIESTPAERRTCPATQYSSACSQWPSSVQTADRARERTPPAAVLLKKACGIESGSGVPNKTKVAQITREQITKIAEQKMPDLNAGSLEAAISMVAGTARSMGITVVD